MEGFSSNFALDDVWILTMMLNGKHQCPDETMSTPSASYNHYRNVSWFFYLPTLLQGYIEPLRVQKKLEFNLF